MAHKVPFIVSRWSQRRSVHAAHLRRPRRAGAPHDLSAHQRRPTRIARPSDAAVVTRLRACHRAGWPAVVGVGLCRVPRPARPVPAGPNPMSWVRPCLAYLNAAPRWTGKPLQIAVDGVPPTGSGRSSSRARNRAAQAANGQVEMFQIGPLPPRLTWIKAIVRLPPTMAHCI